MIRWAWITVGLYVLLCVVMAVITLLITFYPDVSVDELLTNWNANGWWEMIGIWAGVIGLCQLCLLLIPVRYRRQRLRRKRDVRVTAFAAATAMAVLFGIASLCITAVFTGKDFDHADEYTGWGLLALTLATWIAWLFIFLFLYVPSPDQPQPYLRRIFHRLFYGSVLELLVAIPSHIYMRHRDDCCAPVVSFFGIVTGLAVMLMAFGPGVYFLFTRRMAAITPPPSPNHAQPCQRCGYDLRGSTASTACPECGCPIGGPYQYEPADGQPVRR